MSARINSTLKIGLLGNVLFSLICALVLIVFSGPLATYLGIPDAGTLTFIGVGLLPFAAHLLVALRRKNPRVGEIYYLSAMDGMWVAASAVVLVFGLVPLTVAGLWVVGLVALAVADFMVVQLIGVRKIQMAA